MTQSSGPDPFEFLKMLWGPMGLPLPGLVTPTLDVSEIDKRIAELKSVESWLTMNLNLLKVSIQGLEMQRATLAAMQGMQAAGAEAARAGVEAARGGAGSAQSASTGNPFADAWWNVLQQQAQAAQPAEQNDAAKK
jgi:hypothetical protein